jgi:OmpA-OmpF porin, OOP family
MIPRLFHAIALVGLLSPVPGVAGDLILPPGARLQGDRVNPLDSYALPLGPFADGTVPTRDLEGRITRQSWRLDRSAASTLQVLAPLRDQLLNAGFKILLDCRDLACGGFDFRFAIEVIPSPDMHVNIRDYRFVSATRGNDEALSLLISRTGNAVYVQMVHVSPPDGAGLQVVAQAQQPEGQDPPRQTAGTTGTTAIAGPLISLGHVALNDLIFDTGAAALGGGPFATLQQLAGFLAENPGYRIALVGHTDNVGSLDDNISLSKRRAGAVRTRLIEKYGGDPARIDAEGNGYLAPVASNLTSEGRKANRRVEAILLPN